jgi:hypothetical protein
VPGRRSCCLDCCMRRHPVHAVADPLPLVQDISVPLPTLSSEPYRCTRHPDPSSHPPRGVPESEGGRECAGEEVLLPGLLREAAAAALCRSCFWRMYSVGSKRGLGGAELGRGARGGVESAVKGT